MFSKRSIGSLIVICFGMLMAPQFCGQSVAETIPFDYWYGRIVGRTQIQAMHDAYNGQYGVLTTSMKVGHGNDVSVNLGTLFDVTEASRSNALLVRPYRPVLSANVALGPRLRWQIDRLDWQEDATYTSGDVETRFTQRSEFITDQSVMMLRHDIEYDSTRSLYYYTEGMFLQPRNWRLDTHVQGSIYDAWQDVRWLKRLTPDADTSLAIRMTEVNLRRWDIDANFGYGIARKLQLQVAWRIGRQSRPTSWLEEIRAGNEADSLLRRNRQDSETLGHEYQFSLGSVFLMSDHQWAGVQLDFLSNPGTYRREVTGLTPVASVDAASEKDRTYGLAFNHDLIIGGRSVPRAQLLDDFGGYYGRRLSPGSIHFATKGELSFRRQHTTNSISDEIRGRDIFDQREYREDILTGSSEITYFSRYHLDLSLSLSLESTCSGNAETISMANFRKSQRRYFKIRLAYYSFRWDPNKRRDIGWESIQDIDYLYGPLLRPRDVWASISVTPPADRWSYRDNSESVFNFFRGESDNLWELNIAGAFGLCEGLEAGLAASFRQYSPPATYGYNSWQQTQQDLWTVQPSLRWQPGSRFRVDFTLLERYDDYDLVFQHEDVRTHEHSYQHSWEIIVKYNILI